MALFSFPWILKIGIKSLSAELNVLSTNLSYRITLVLVYTIPNFYS